VPVAKIIRIYLEIAPGISYSTPTCRIYISIKFYSVSDPDPDPDWIRIQSSKWTGSPPCTVHLWHTS
jgi:hypothetical protein